MRRCLVLALLVLAVPAWAAQPVRPIPTADCTSVKQRLDAALGLLKPLRLAADEPGFSLFEDYEGSSCHLELEGTGLDLEPDPSLGWQQLGPRISAALEHEGFFAAQTLNRYDATSPDAEAFARQRGPDLCAVGIGYLSPTPGTTPPPGDRNYLVHVDCVRRP